MLIASLLLFATVAPAAQSVGDRVTALVTEFRMILAVDGDAAQTERLETIATALEDAVRLERRAPSPIAPTLAFIDQRLFVRAELLARRRGHGNETPLLEHARFLLWAAHALDPNAVSPGPMPDPRAVLIDNVEGRRALRAKYGLAFVDAAIELSRALRRLGRDAEAREELQMAERRMQDIPGALERIRAEQKRVLLADFPPFLHNANP